MKKFIKHKLRQGIILEIEDEKDICDDFSINSEEELLKLINNTDNISKEQEKEVRDELKSLKKSNKYLSNDLDNNNTVAHKIGTTLCSKTNPENLD
jgi:hypothetical protein